MRQARTDDAISLHIIKCMNGWKTSKHPKRREKVNTSKFKNSLNVGILTENLSYFKVFELL